MAVLRPEQLQDLARRRLGLEAESQVATRRLNEDYGIDSKLIGQQSQQAQRDTADQLASQGLFHSGIRVNEQGNIQRDANQALSDLNLQRSRGLENVSTELARGIADLDFQKSQALAEANRQEQERNMQRALLDAQRNAMMVGGIGYPGSVIGLTGGQAGALAQIPGFQGRGPYNSFQAFRAANPQLANTLMFFNGGDFFGAERQAVRDGYIIPVRQAPVGGRQSF